jgi:hypothetical protein
MRLPVISPFLEPLRDMPGVFQCKSREEFTHLAGSVARQQIDEAALAGFIQRHNWSSRVKELLGFLDSNH